MSFSCLWWFCLDSIACRYISYCVLWISIQNLSLISVHHFESSVAYFLHTSLVVNEWHGIHSANLTYYKQVGFAGLFPFLLLLLLSSSNNCCQVILGRIRWPQHIINMFGCSVYRRRNQCISHCMCIAPIWHVRAIAMQFPCNAHILCILYNITSLCIGNDFSHCHHPKFKSLESHTLPSNLCNGNAKLLTNNCCLVKQYEHISTDYRAPCVSHLR